MSSFDQIPTSFADRLWASRQHAKLGATKLARLVGCAQSLVSFIENNNTEKTQFSNAFAKALNVDPVWLAEGTPGRAPPWFDAETARRRKKGVHIIGSFNRSALNEEPPRWSQPERLAEPLAPLTGADAMMKGLMNGFMDFAKLAGRERALGLLTTLKQVADLMSAEEAGGQQQVRAPD